MRSRDHFGLEADIFEWACADDPEYPDVSTLMVVHHMPQRFDQQERTAAEWLRDPAELVEMIVRFEAGVMRRRITALFDPLQAMEPFEFERRDDALYDLLLELKDSILDTWVRVNLRVRDFPSGHKFTPLAIIELVLWAPD